MSATRLLCRSSALGIDDARDGLTWPDTEVLLSSVARAGATSYLLALPESALEGIALTTFLARVAPFGCPPPPSLIRAYSLPDSPYPSILLGEHEEAPDGTGDAYHRFVAVARRHWLAALHETGPGLCPTVAWQSGPLRRFLAADELASRLAETCETFHGVADQYLGRGLLLLAHPELASPWQSLMSLGGVTKIRKITGREFPVWVDLPAHQPALLGSPLLARVEQLLADQGAAGVVR